MIAGVVEYSSSSDDEDQTEINKSSDSNAVGRHGRTDTEVPSASVQNLSKSQTKHLKRSCTDSVVPPDQESKRLKSIRKDTSLPLPSAIQNLYGNDNDQRTPTEDPSKHGGRVRTFQHVEGNWATFVYIPVNPDTRLLELFMSLVQCLRPLQFEMMSDFHITLSRTVVIRHHWIDLLMDSLRESLSTCVSCICDVLEPRLYTNDEKTRTFLCLEIQREGSNLSSYVCAVDKCLEEFRLQSYYQDPSFHISFGWCLGDVIADVSSQKLKHMKGVVAGCFNANPDLSVVEVREIECKTGKKVFRFQLQEDDR